MLFIGEFRKKITNKKNGKNLDLAQRKPYKYENIVADLEQDFILRIKEFDVLKKSKSTVLRLLHKGLQGTLYRVRHHQDPN